MKWLLLILLVSCGQHQQPKRIDNQDADGDNIINFQEGATGDAKFIANISPLKELSGQLSFRAGIGTVQDFSFAIDNAVDQKTQNLKLLTRHSKALKTIPHFTERSAITIRNPLPIKDIPEAEFYDLTLNFHTVREEPKQLLLHDGADVIDEGSWRMDMVVRVSRGTLERLLTGEAYFSLSKFPSEQLEAVRERTYRVFLSDETESKVLYVSNELPIEKFLARFKQIPTDVSGIDLLGVATVSRKQWWSRNLKGDWVFVFTSLQELKASHLTGYVKSKGRILRTEGKSVTKLALKKHKDARVMVRIWGGPQKLRKIKERSQTIMRGYRDDRWPCKMYFREVVGVSTPVIGIAEIPSLLSTHLDAAPFPLLRNERVNAVRVVDKASPFLELQIDARGSDLEFALGNLPPDTFRQIGRYKSECDPVKVSTLNVEAELTFEYESYVEKIEEKN